jgi:gamma-D-glutamyl-L-lysine dipeptidyl-peptidase
MKDLFFKPGFLTLLLFFTVHTLMAQTETNKTYFQELQDELDLFTPDSLLGNKIWGLATLSVSNMRSAPKHSSELVSQVTMGTPVKLIEENEGWIRVETPEGYNGWMDTCGLKRLTPEEIDQWKSPDRYLFNHMNGYAFDAPNRKGQIVTDLVLGDIFVVEGKKKAFFKIHTPDGRIGWVKKVDCISWTDWINKEPDVQALLSVAKQMLGSPYLWGGTSVKAADCSGFVKTTFFSQAVILERDASQQARNGESVDFTKIDSLQPGDLLFFGPSAQHIIHVGIYLGKGDYIHSSGLVRISSIDPNDLKYNVTEQKNLVAARRILNSLNTEGIVRVKDHPWYNSYISYMPAGRPKSGLDELPALEMIK